MLNGKQIHPAPLEDLLRESEKRVPESVTNGRAQPLPQRGGVNGYPPVRECDTLADAVEEALARRGQLRADHAAGTTALAQRGHAG